MTTVASTEYITISPSFVDRVSETLFLITRRLSSFVYLKRYVVETDEFGVVSNVAPRMLLAIYLIGLHFLQI